MTNIKENFGSTQVGTDGTYNWSVNSDGTLTITLYIPPPQSTTTTATGTTNTSTGTTTTATGTTAAAKNNLIILNIPSTLNNNIVTILGPNSFQNANNFDTVNIPSSVTAIGDSAFMGCSNLKYFGLYSDTQLITIGPNAFNGTSIRTPTIPATVESIGDNAFKTTNLYSVTFLGNCPSFSNNAFTIENANTYNNTAANLSPGTKVIVYYFNDKTGFNSLNTTYFITVSVPEMFTPIDPTTHNPIWVILLIMIIIIIILYGAAKLI
jgi:hypothetical protein